MPANNRASEFCFRLAWLQVSQLAWSTRSSHEPAWEHFTDFLTGGLILIFIPEHLSGFYMWWQYFSPSQICVFWNEFKERKTLLVLEKCSCRGGRQFLSLLDCLPLLCLEYSAKKKSHISVTSGVAQSQT